MQSQGKVISSIFSAPGISLDTFKLDWLHIADLGVAADWLGQSFEHMLTKIEGRTKDARVKELWRRIQHYYKNTTISKLDNLTSNMIKATGARTAKLKAHAAESRGLVPIALQLAKDILSEDDPLDAAVLQVTQELASCYECLSAGADQSTLADHSRRFCTLWVTLEAMHDRFGIKPKMHLFQELCEQSGPTRPSAHWTYRDEDFGGSIVGLARHRGGPKTPGATGHRVLMNFCARYPFPVVC